MQTPRHTRPNISGIPKQVQKCPHRADRRETKLARSPMCSSAYMRSPVSTGIESYAILNQTVDVVNPTIRLTFNTCALPSTRMSRSSSVVPAYLLREASSNVSRWCSPFTTISGFSGAVVMLGRKRTYLDDGDGGDFEGEDSDAFSTRV